MSKVDKLLEKHAMIEELYDIIRIVDPFTKKVLDTKFIGNYDKKIIGLEDMVYCFDFWRDHTVCENCISARVMNEKRVYMKTEYNGQDVYIITSVPVELDGIPYILEVINEITEKGLLNELQGKDYFEIKKTLKERNQQMITDELTGAFNRRFINERIPAEMLLYDANQQNIVIAMADIDFFKKVNDTYGHDAGDFILKNVVAIITENIRYETDWVARYGGEEFIVFLKNISNEKAFEKFNQIREAIEAKDFLYGDEIIKITISFGMKEFANEQEMTEWVKKADENLYKSKENGRNKVTW
ncbi:MAG: GGDEF domain-containing protein [Clostridiales bacterium]|nr:GGDEF domain-containing protein [Clostridiales bacterium]